MSASNAGSFGPSPQQLSLQVSFPTQTTCSNIRYMFAGCLHILLLRCAVHPVSQATGEYGSNTSSKPLFNTCPNPQATFSAIEAQGSCPLCAEQAATRLKMLNLETRITSLEADIKQARANRGGSRNGMSPFAMKGEIAKAELQRAKEALKALTRTGETISEAMIQSFIDELAVAEPIKAELRALTPFTYTGMVR